MNSVVQDPKNILIFSLAYYPRFVGGAEVSIKEITDRISPDNIRFHLICLRFDTEQPREEKIGNVTVHRVGWGKKGTIPNTTYGVSWTLSKILFVPSAAYKAWKLNRTHHFDGVWAMMAYMLFPTILARALGVRAPYVLTLQEGDPFEYVFGRLRMRLFAPILSYGFRHARVIQTISTYLGTWARLLHFKGPLEVVPNGVATDVFATAVSPEAILEVRKNIGKKEGETWLIHTGRLVHKNGLDAAVRALGLLPDSVHLFMIGDGPARPLLEEVAKEVGVSSRIHFHPYIPLNELPVYLRACDIFIRPSRSEGMGNSFIEAMAAELPVIGTQEGGIADFLFDARKNPEIPTTGFAVSVDAPQEIADTVVYIQTHTDEVRLAAQNASALVREKFEWNLVARLMETQVFQKLFV